MLKTKASSVILSPLQEAHDLLRGDLNQMEKISTDAPFIKDVMDHLLKDPGKRLRPILTLLSARLCGSHADPKVIAFASCVEFMHTATLLHDDVIDGSTLRRGKKCVHQVWGNQISILVGDFLFSRAFESVMDMGSFPVLRLLSKTITTMTEGELLQMSARDNFTMTEDAYFQIIEAKTAQLFAAACKGAALITAAPLDKIQALEAYGYNLGILFQMTDDLLDYTLKLGDDFKEGKITLPLLLIHEKLSDQKETSLKELKDFSQAVYFFEYYNIEKKILERAKIYAQNSLKYLEIFPDSPEKKLLTELVNFCLHRKS